MELTTKRLILKELTLDNLDDLRNILQDNITMTYYGGAFSDELVTLWLLRNLERYQTKGLGLHAVYLKNSNKMIGQCGISYQDVEGKDVLEVGYLFNKNFWHKGYATEASQAFIDYAFTHLDADIIYSTIRQTNTPSIKVAKRNHMTVYQEYIKEFNDELMPHYLYGVTKDVYYAKNNPK
mgnify:FL=1